MHNGEIYSNKAGDGGGIMLGSAYDDEGDKGDFIIEKGIIRDNKAFYTYGGGNIFAFALQRNKNEQCLYH